MGFNALRINKEVCPKVEGHISDKLSDWAIDFAREQHAKSQPHTDLFLQMRKRIACAGAVPWNIPQGQICRLDRTERTIGIGR